MIRKKGDDAKRALAWCLREWARLLERDHKHAGQLASALGEVNRLRAKLSIIDAELDGEKERSEGLQRTVEMLEHEVERMQGELDTQRRFGEELENGKILNGNNSGVKWQIQLAKLVLIVLCNSQAQVNAATHK